jgi:Rps23 Pro-64 3,4-dihydroxylase Tpa1-like proline 4-hydroxylase
MSVFAEGDPSGLERLRSMDPQVYAAAQPFPHAVVHDVFDEDLLDRVVAEFPSADDMAEQFDAPEERKSAESRWERFGPATKELLADLNSEPFVDALEHLTGTPGLITDHRFVGGGQHQIQPGGYLGIHADFNRHRQMDVNRRLNVLVYLNRDWDESWGGHLELWDQSMTAAVVKVAPIFNTMVVFTTDSTSFHGHPDPLASPPGITRRSIATYYYAAFPGRQQPDRHTTLFQDRPGVPSRTSRYTKAMQKYRQGARLAREGTRLLVPDKVVAAVKRTGSKG